MEDRSIEWVPFRYAENRIAAKMIIPYPPGIPTILPGEVITEEKIRLIKKYIEMHAKFQGETSRLLNGKLQFIYSSVLNKIQRCCILYDRT